MRSTASIIINSYNYARFLPRAIESALAQNFSDVEVIVVDDGSTDDSPAIITGYGDHIRSILKPNGGQASSLNAGFAASTGDIVVFLDSDDLLLPTALEHASELLQNTVSKVHWPMKEIRADAQPTGHLVPASPLPRGDLRQDVLDHGPRSPNNVWPPTSGNAWPRWFLERVMPIPETAYPTCPDLYLCSLSPLYGLIERCDEPLGLWRNHGANSTFRDDFPQRIKRNVIMWDHCFNDILTHAGSSLHPTTVRQWQKESWWHRVDTCVEDLRRILPASEPFVLADFDEWSCAGIDGRRAVPFVERSGVSHGAPSDDRAAIGELNRHIESGVRSVVFSWSSFWWFESYPALAQFLNQRATTLLRNERLAVFHLSA